MGLVLVVMGSVLVVMCLVFAVMGLVLVVMGSVLVVMGLVLVVMGSVLVVMGLVLVVMGLVLVVMGLVLVVCSVQYMSSRVKLHLVFAYTGILIVLNERSKSVHYLPGFSLSLACTNILYLATNGEYRITVMPLYTILENRGHHNHQYTNTSQGRKETEIKVMFICIAII